MTTTEVVSLRRKNAPLTSVRKASEYNQSVVLDTSVYLIGTISLDRSLILRNTRGQQLFGLQQGIKRDLGIGRELLEDLLERLEYDERMIFPEQVMIELRYKVRAAQKILFGISESYRDISEAQDTSIFQTREGITQRLIHLCQENISSLGQVIETISTKIGQIAYKRDSITRDCDPDVEIIFSALQFAKESAPGGNIAFVTLDRGFKDKIQRVARNLNGRSGSSERIYLYEIERNLTAFRALYIHN